MKLWTSLYYKTCKNLKTHCEKCGAFIPVFLGVTPLFKKDTYTCNSCGAYNDFGFWNGGFFGKLLRLYMITISPIKWSVGKVRRFAANKLLRLAQLIARHELIGLRPKFDTWSWSFENNPTLWLGYKDCKMSFTFSPDQAKLLHESLNETLYTK